MTLSTLTVAANNTACRVPIFVQVMDRRRAQYLGVYTDANFRTSFEMSVLPGRGPPDVRRLPELAHVFRKKVRDLIIFNTFIQCILSSYLSFVKVVLSNG